MAAQDAALADLEARHEQEWAAFKEEAAVLRAGASKKKKKEVEFDLARREDDLRYRQNEELEALGGGGDDASDAGTIEDAPNAAEVARQKAADEAAAVERKKAKAAKKRGKKADKSAAKREKQAAINAETAELERNSKRKAEIAAIDAKLAPLGLKTKDVAADGHCLYRSVADQLGDGRDYAALRRTCANFLEAHADDFLPFVALDADDPAAFFERHCAEVRSTAAWGGQPELLALAKALSRKVAVFARDAPVVEMGEGSEAPLVVTYHRDYYALGEHYNSTEPLE